MSRSASKRGPQAAAAAMLLTIMAATAPTASAADHRRATPEPPMGTMPAVPMGSGGMMAPPAGAPPMGTMQPENMRSSEAALVRTLLPTVVNISSRKVEPAARGEPSRILTLSGSGFIVEPSGVIATNYHVVDGAYEVVVTFWDGSRAPARLLAASKIGDIAVLKVDVGHRLPVVTWGNSEAVQIGDPVIAIGNPLGIGMSVTSGIVSALNRDIMASPFDNFIQTDAPINHGNSGGPLFNMAGHVIGIDTAIYSPTTGSVGIGFAIPSNDAQFVIGRLLKYGAVKPAWIGVSLQQVTPDIAEALGMERPDGSILSDVQPDSPAAKAGLRIGDVIMSVGGKPARDTRAVMRDIAVIPAGTAVEIGFWRDGKDRRAKVTVADWPRAAKLDKPLVPAGFDRATPPDLGLQIVAFDNDARAKYGLDFDQPGLLVTGVAANTDAADRGLAAGDVILQVQDQPVDSPEAFRKQIARARAAKRRLVLVLIQPRLEAEPAQTAGMSSAGPKSPMDQKKMMMGLQWGPPKWVALRVANG
jgi:serine protease Do